MGVTDQHSQLQLFIEGPNDKSFLFWDVKEFRNRLPIQHSFSSFDVSSGRLPFYLGVGGRVLLGDSSQLGVRLPLGASYLFPNDPIETFAELAPVVRIIKGIGLDMDGVLGVRVYINYLK